MFLKDMTWDIHVRLEKRLTVKDRFSDIDHYRNHLGRLWAFQAAAEENWAGRLQEALADFPIRRKAHLLAQDVAALGGVLPHLAEVPAANDAPAALGGFYVLEGATLGGQFLLPIVERKLGLSARHGASYLASYGTEVQPMWRQFVATVEACCANPQSRERAGAAARETFLALENWLCRDPENQ